MCGIFGAIARRERPLRHPDAVPRMAAALRHRGPDGECIVGHERARIGARRLAIMDLTTGDQPFQSPDGRVWMVCNGEIYNAPELRRQASGPGWQYPFRSTGDIETVVPFYERFGADAVAKLDGMFGLAIWDDARRRLILARDRAGEKPLFWTESDGELRFASEIQALLEFPDQARRLNQKALSLYRALGYVPAPYTMFDGIHKLPPASLLIAEDGQITIRSYWSAAEAASSPPVLESAAQLRTALLSAVERELMSDVPLGVFTSGGLDSSLLVAAAARALPGERIHTYAVRFTEPGYDESAYAEAVTHDIATAHHVVTAGDESLGRALEVISRSLAEPLGDPAVLPTWLLADAARADVKVILSGEGADELFGGYPTYLGHKFAERWLGVPGGLRAVVRWAVERWPSSTGKMTVEYMLKQFVAATERPWAERHLSWLGAMAIEEGVVAELSCKLAGFPHTDPLNRLMWFDYLTYLPDDLLVKVDRATMLASVEARAPYLDRELMELVLGAPSRLKVRGLSTKVILKEAARGLVPDRVIDRRKRGLSVPVARWLNTSLAPLADRVLDTPLLAEHRSGRRNHARRLWPQLMLALWSERWGVEIE
jgi:asparagine synthase (glutamine-hydrolysing)